MNRKSKPLLLLAILVLGNFCCSAQIPKQFSFGIHFLTGPTNLHITDDMVSPSSVDLAADGETSVGENRLAGRNFELVVDYEIQDFWGVSSGLSFSQRRLNVKNIDGNYEGTSVYYLEQTHIPLLARYESNLLGDDFHLRVSFGVTVDIKRSETAQGSDYAHFMNFAHNDFATDPTRGRNGNNTRADLFQKTGISAYSRLGVEYQMNENFGVFGGLSWHRSISNILNSDLLYNDDSKTPISETMSWKTGLIGLNLGVRYHI